MLVTNTVGLPSLSSYHLHGGREAPKIRKKKYFLSNYYVEFGHFSGKNHVKSWNFVNFSGKYHKSSGILIIFRARIAYNLHILLIFRPPGTAVPDGLMFYP